jgi:hypothetical protein
LQEDGISLQVHLESHWRQTGVLPEQLNVAPIPYELAHVWGWWMQLQATRSTGMEQNHITFQEIASWSNLLGIGVSQFEVRGLMALDTCFITHSASVRAAKAASQA